jgi:hypothetical protein
MKESRFTSDEFMDVLSPEEAAVDKARAKLLSDAEPPQLDSKAPVDRAAPKLTSRPPNANLK